MCYGTATQKKHLIRLDNPPLKSYQDLIKEKGSIANDTHNDICLPAGSLAIGSRRYFPISKRLQFLGTHYLYNF